MTHNNQQTYNKWYNQLFPRHVFNEYFCERFEALVAHPCETMALFEKVDNGTAPKPACPRAAAELRACSVFVAGLKRMINCDAPEAADARQVYELCREFKINKPTITITPGPVKVICSLSSVLSLTPVGF